MTQFIRLIRRALVGLVASAAAAGLLVPTGSPASATVSPSVLVYYSSLVAPNQPNVSSLYTGGFGGQGGLIFAAWGGQDPVGSYLNSANGPVTWQQQTLYQGAESIRPQIATDQLRQWLTWTNEGQVQTDITSRVSSNGGVNWGPTTTAATSPNGVYSSDLAVSGDGTTGDLVYSDYQVGATPAEMKWIRSTDQGNSWSAPETLSTDLLGASQPQIASSADGQKLICAWVESFSGGNWIAYRRSINGGLSWSDKDHFAMSLAYNRDLQVTMSADGGTVHAAWKSYEADVPNRMVVNSSTDGGATWTGNQEVGQSEYVGPPQLVASTDGVNANLTWESGQGEVHDVATSRTTNSGGTWSSAASLVPTGTSAFDPQVAASSNGSTVAAVWWAQGATSGPSNTRTAPTNEIQITTSTNGGKDWAAPVTLSEVGKYADLPRIAVAEDGQSLVAMWVVKSAVTGANRSGASGDDIYAAVGSIPTPPGPTPTPTPTKKVQKPRNGKGKPPARIAKDGITLITGRNARTNAGQLIRTRVRCVPMKAATAGETRYCRVLRGPKGKVRLRTYGKPVRVIVMQTAAPTTEYKRYVKRTVYVNGVKR